LKKDSVIYSIPSKLNKLKTSDLQSLIISYAEEVGVSSPSFIRTLIDFLITFLKEIIPEEEYETWPEKDEYVQMVKDLLSSFDENFTTLQKITLIKESKTTFNPNLYASQSWELDDLLNTWFKEAIYDMILDYFDKVDEVNINSPLLLDYLVKQLKISSNEKAHSVVVKISNTKTMTADVMIIKNGPQ